MKWNQEARPGFLVIGAELTCQGHFLAIILRKLPEILDTMHVISDFSLNVQGQGLDQSL